MASYSKREILRKRNTLTGDKKAPPPKYPEKINLLALPRGRTHICELCDDRGKLKCPSCGVTYYCSLEHYRTDKEMHSYACKRLKLLRQPIEFQSNSDERAIARHERRQLELDMRDHSLRVGQASLEQGKYDLGIASASLSTKYTDPDVDVPSTVMPLLVVAECHLHKGNLTVAEAFMARALNIEREAGKIQPSVRAQIRHIEGMLNLAKDNIEKAKEDFAEEVYQNTKGFGSDHLRTSAGYCYLGESFQMTEDYAIAASFYRQTVNIWIDTTEPILEEMTTQSQVPAKNVQGALHFVQKRVWMNHYDLYLGMKIITKCKDLTECNPEATMPMDIVRVLYAAASLYFISEQYSNCKHSAKEGLLYLQSADMQRDPHQKLMTDIIKYCDRRTKDERVATTSSTLSSPTSFAEECTDLQNPTEPLRLDKI